MIMHDSIMLFDRQLSDIRLHNECFTSLKKVLSLSKTSIPDAKIIIKSWSNECIFNYRSNIISIYGSFEQFVESSIKEYISELLHICSSFTQLDKPIKDEYIEKWKSLLGKLHYNKFQSITQTYMIESLYNSQINDKNEIIAECFLQNGGNYKHEEIMKAFSSLGLTDIRTSLAHYEPLSTYFMKNGFDNYLKINELVELRNEIAHGSNSDSLLSGEIVLDYVNYIGIYAMSLTEYLNDQLLEHVWNLRDHYAIYKPTNFYAAKNIVEFSEPDILLYEGMEFLIKRTKDFYPRYIDGKLPIFRAKKAEAPNSQIEEKNELYGDGRWMFSFPISYKITTQFRFAFYL